MTHGRPLQLLTILPKPPHAAVIVVTDFSACLEIRFCGNVYFGTP